MTINGWEIFHYYLFDDILCKLKQDVVDLKNKDKELFVSHPKSKLLAKTINAIYKIVPENPDHPSFRLGLTLGKDFTAWKRVKYALPDRYRLFFRFSSKQKTIIYVWLNDETCLRKEGSKTDVYQVFKSKITSGAISSEVSQLIANSSSPS